MFIKIIIDIDGINTASWNINLTNGTIIKFKDILDELIARFSYGAAFF